MKQFFLHQWEFLRKSAELGRLSHAYIFSGNDREAKRDTAFRLAKFLNCEQQERKPCDVCKSCKAIEGRRFPDVTFLKPAVDEEASWRKEEIKISQIRELSAYLSLGAWVSPWKIIIMEKAHAMNQEAQSAFLKLLEEPKGNTLFLLLADYSQILLDTIRSRAQEIKFYNFKQFSKASSESQKNFEKLHTLSIQERFVWAKKLSESPEHMQETLEDFLRYARIRLLEKVKENSGDVPKLLRTVRTIQGISFLLGSTNINTRLALERMLLEF
ncbi:MAG: hypothetical protein AAB567_01240 [Patescibacteria group bacterium]